MVTRCLHIHKCCPDKGVDRRKLKADSVFHTGVIIDTVNQLVFIQSYLISSLFRRSRNFVPHDENTFATPSSRTSASW